MKVDGPVARLVVETAGAVLHQDQVQQLAQPFRRLGADRTGSERGAGLGLSIVAAIAEASPRHAQPSGQARWRAAGRHRAAPGGGAGERRGATRVLVVEDC